jgi:very-short-patch-repair endonuclease
MLFRDAYADAEMPVTHLLKCQAAGLILPPGAALTGRSAARVAGLALGEPDDPVQVIVPTGEQFGGRGLSVRRAWLPAAQVVPGKPRLTVPQRTAWEIAREPNLVEAEAALDVLFAGNYLRPGAMDDWVAVSPRSKAAKALGLADGRAESPQESRARVRLVLAGLPVPTPQFKVWLRGRFGARLDLAWPAAKIAVEYDGLWHAERRQFLRDRSRANKLLDAGWTVYTMTCDDLSDPIIFAAFVARLRDALARAC